MSIRDKQFLNESGLTQAEAARFLGVHRQSISRGVSNEDVNYLGIEQLLRISKQLRDKKDERYKYIRPLISEIYPTSAELIDELQAGQKDLDPTKTEFDELWVFSSKPKELISTEYFEAMRDVHYADPKKTISFFVPPGLIANQMRAFVKHALRGRALHKTAEIFIFSTEVVSYSPHFSILDPGHNASGWVLAADGLFYELPKDRIEDTISAVRQVGIGILQPNLLKAELNETSKHRLFTMEYWNRDE